ncbi:MAG TPA: aminotransferase class IV [Bacteroidales bacterium]|nr:aminotransferase class IV [Bacteroidales bacterium]
MEIVYFNGNFIPKEEVSISPDDRGFLFADGIYEVVRWYGKAFYDIDGHVKRLKRSLGELNINWTSADVFPSIAERLVSDNNLVSEASMVYLQVTRGVARRSHYFPVPVVQPTAYAFAFRFSPDEEGFRNGIRAILKPDIRWTRCDIKSIALLPNTMGFNEAYTGGYKECIFVRDGLVTEGAHSNIFFVKDGAVITHPESNFILSGISRKNVIRMAHVSGIKVTEEPLNEDALKDIHESFITNTSSEITPVTELGGITIGNGEPGPVTRKLQELFRSETVKLSGGS